MLTLLQGMVIGRSELHKIAMMVAPGSLCRQRPPFRCRVRVELVKDVGFAIHTLSRRRSAYQFVDINCAIPDVPPETGFGRRSQALSTDAKFFARGATFYVLMVVRSFP